MRLGRGLGRGLLPAGKEGERLGFVREVEREWERERRRMEGRMGGR